MRYFVIFDTDDKHTDADVVATVQRAKLQGEVAQVTNQTTGETIYTRPAVDTDPAGDTADTTTEGD